MKLTFEQIQSIARGVAYVSEEDGGVLFHRFTAEQEKMYEKRDSGFYDKTKASAGVRLHFQTDSTALRICADIIPKGSSRTRYSIDVHVNDKPVAFFDNDDPAISYPSDQYAYGPIDCAVDLGKGMKEVQVYLPFSMCPIISSVELDDGAQIVPIKPEKQMLLFGDSITHGYDAFRSSNSYANRLVDALGVNAINKGIGGEIFVPDLAKLKDDVTPDYISVAYGTNDWSKCQPDQFRANCREFYKALHDNYPTARIFAITPIWREDFDRHADRAPFLTVGETIRELTADLERVTVIDGFDAVPHDTGLFADFRLHPNDAGFDYYADFLIAKIKGALNA